MAKSYTKFETVGITRHGFSILHTQGIDAAAEVTYHGYTPDEVHDAREAVKSFWLVPLPFPGDYR